MTDRSHTLARLVSDASPMPARRAAAVMVAVAEEVVRRESLGEAVELLPATAVTVGDDGTVVLPPAVTGRHHSTDPQRSDPSAGGATLGRLYFELLVGRRPLGRADAHEPALTAALDPPVCALLARSFADAPGQWPEAATWAATFGRIAGGLAPPPSPTRVRRDRRRRAVTLGALALLAAVTVVVLLAAPGWWDSTSEGSLSPRCAPGGEATDRYCERARP